MGEVTEQLTWNLANERRQLERNLHELEDKVTALRDWRTYYRRQPVAVLGAAFGGALLLGLIGGRRSSSVQSFASEAEDRPQRRFRLSPPLVSSVDRAAHQASDTWTRISDALLGVAAAKAIDYVGRRVPGFREEYERRQAPR